jgi:hypothetical protein
VVVNDDASDEQLDAIDRIMRGQEGGPFEMFASLYGNYLGTERGEVTFSDGDTPSFSIRGNSFTFEPLPGPEGSDTHTTVEPRLDGVHRGPYRDREAASTKEAREHRDRLPAAGSRPGRRIRAGKRPRADLA